MALKLQLLQVFFKPCNISFYPSNKICAEFDPSAIYV